MHRNRRIRECVLDYTFPAAGDDKNFTIQELRLAVESFDPKKTPGEAGIEQRVVVVLRVLKVLLESILTLYIECLRGGRFPDIWKGSIIDSVEKPDKEHSTGVDKYRPISLLSLWGKLVEKLFINRIMHYLKSNDFVCDMQCGFTQ